MKKEQKLILILVAVAAGGYLILRWWENRQSGSNETGLGTNLNSLPSALVAGSTGPQSGLNYYAGATNVYVSENVTQAASSAKTGGGTGGGLWPISKPPTWYSGGTKLCLLHRVHLKWALVLTEDCLTGIRRLRLTLSGTLLILPGRHFLSSLELHHGGSTLS